MSKTKPATPKAERGDGGYPYTSLDNSLRFGRIVRHHGGRNVPKAVIAQELKMEEGKSGFYAQVASAKCYGIVEGSRDLSLTDAGHDYFFPQSDTDQAVAALQFLNSPLPFRAIIQRFDGQRLPDASMLANMTQRQFGVAKTWSARVAAIFINAAKDLGAIDSAGFLRYESALHKAGRSAPGTAQPTGNDSPATADRPSAEPGHVPAEQRAQFVTPPTAGADVSTSIVAYVDGKDMFRLQFSTPLSRAMWERLKRHVDAMEPDKAGT